MGKTKLKNRKAYSKYATIGKINFGEMGELQKATTHKEVFEILNKAQERIINDLFGFKD